jgi:hypothetical protein
MSSELQLVESILKGLNTPNNEQRKNYEMNLGELIQKNTIGLVLCLS